MSFHYFDSFNFIYFSIIKNKKLNYFNKKNKNKSIVGCKINLNKKSKEYKFLSTYLYNLKLTNSIIYNIININFNVYNYKMHILLCNNYGNMYYVPYTQNINLFKFYTYSKKIKKNLIDLQLPYLYIDIYRLKLSTIIFNIYKSFNQYIFINKMTYCRAPGSTAKIIMHNRLKLLTYITLPSKLNIYIDSLNGCFIYLNPIFKIEESRKLPKASIRHKLGYKSKVRGVAKNAYDHPHGGNTNIIKIKKNPWGKRV